MEEEDLMRASVEEEVGDLRELASEESQLVEVELDLQLPSTMVKMLELVEELGSELVWEEVVLAEFLVPTEWARPRCSGSSSAKSNPMPANCESGNQCGCRMSTRIAHK